MTLILDFLVVLYVAAIAAVSVGAGLVYLPAGLIVCGVLVAASIAPLLLSALKPKAAPRDL